MAFMGVRNKQIGRLLRILSFEHNWHLERAGSGHIRARAPFGARLIVSLSASDPRAYMNIRSDVRRAYRAVNLEPPV